MSGLLWALVVLPAVSGGLLALAGGDRHTGPDAGGPRPPGTPGLRERVAAAAAPAALVVA
ncbi:hypothetical protein HOY81_21615, partial [Streptomyces sp. JJ36]|nr:hypothetical protein [Streptomyces sp. JJ36]